MMKPRMMKCDCAEPVQPKRVPPKQVWRKPIRQAALGAALGLIALTAIAPGIARAEDSGGDGGILGSMLKGLGIGGENRIEYRERPPLVVPPTRDLPPPQTSATVRDPNWPLDPKSAQPQKKGTQVRDLDRITTPQRPVEPSVAGSGAPAPSAGGPDTTAAIPSSQPAASSGFFGNLFSSSDRAAGPVVSVPARKSLTQPPPDYESPSPSQPYGTTAPRADAAKSTTPESALQTQPGANGL
jgi:hypothetical protein